MTDYSQYTDWLGILKTPKIKVEQEKPIPFDGAFLLTTMARMIKSGTWKWDTSQDTKPQKRRWFQKLLFVIMP